MEQGDSLMNDFAKITKDDYNVFEKKSPRGSMHVKAMVWNRKSHGLFDYESDTNIERSQVTFKHSGMLIREKDKIRFAKDDDSFGDQDEDPDDPRILIFVRQISEDEFTVEPKDDSVNLNNRIWMIIRSVKAENSFLNNSSNGYIIRPNEVIKLGRVILRVTEIRTELGNFDSTYDEFDDTITLKDEPDNDDACRFGWVQEDSEDNPKIGPGMGTGSMKYIHYQGIKQWIDSRKTQKNSPGIYSFTWKNFDGEIGKTPYPYTFIYKKKRWNLHTPYIPEDKNVKYIVLESMKNDRNTGRMVHTLLVSDEKSEYKLGRGHDADVRVNDISVSRLHLKINYTNGRFFMEDCRSKFGTLVLVKKELRIDSTQSKAIQVGRTMLNLSVKDNLGLFDNGVFNDASASKFFDSKIDPFLPMFGKAPNVSENVEDLPIIDRIQNPVYDFKAHSNLPVIKGDLLPQNEYRLANPFRRRNE